MRDNHQTWDFTKSILPPFKRRKEQKQDDTLEYVKNASDGINMEFEELISELEDMDLVEEKTRSDQMDKKILEKKKKKRMIWKKKVGRSRKMNQRLNVKLRKYH